MRSFRHRKMVMCGAFAALLAAFVLGRPQPSQATTGFKQVCKKAACNKQESVDHENCVGDETNKKCVFKTSPNDLIWCSTSEFDICDIVSPVDSNKCKGYCAFNDGLTCYSTEYNKCKNPQ